jgi:hypothetical protein
MKNLCTALCASAAVVLGASTSIAATISVASGAELQTALVSAQPGDTILLAAGTVYTGNFTLSDKGNSTVAITIRTAGDDGLARTGERVMPSMAPRLAKIQSGNSAPAIQTAPGAHHWTLMLVEVVGNGLGDLVTLGDGSTAQASLARVPHDLTFDRVYVHGDPILGQKRAIALNSASTTITGSYFSDIKAMGQDSQAICGWNGPGPYTITNNYIEAAGENVLFGGADPAIPNLVPADITITGNVFSKALAWRSEGWVVKNLFELKNARRVYVAGNLFQYNWDGAQSGFAILFTVRNQDGHCPWCQIDHVTFAANTVGHSGGGIQMLGVDYNYPSQQTNAIVIQNNLFADIDSEHWGGNGYFLSILGGPRDVTIDHNTIISDHGSGVIQADGPPIFQFRFTNNLAKHNAYGIIGTSHGVGNDAIGAFFPASDISSNVLAGGNPGLYPAGNSFPAPEQFEAQFVSYLSGDYRLIGASPWHHAGTDGLDLGVVFGSTSAVPVITPSDGASTGPTQDPPSRQTPDTKPPQ